MDSDYKDVIEKVLEHYSDKQINLASSSSRSNIAAHIARAIRDGEEKRKREEILENFKKMLERRRKSAATKSIKN